MKKEKRLQEVMEKLESIKNELAGIIDLCEDEDDEEMADTLTEALDALEDASEVLEDVCSDME